jgi:hypothetical protein
MTKAKRRAEEARTITLAFNERSYQRLERLEKVVDADSKAGVIGQALQLLEFMANKATDGYEFQVVDSQGHSEKIEILEFQEA